jgi:hypothetical protein
VADASVTERDLAVIADKRGRTGADIRVEDDGGTPRFVWYRRDGIRWDVTRFVRHEARRFGEAGACMGDPVAFTAKVVFDGFLAEGTESAFVSAHDWNGGTLTIRRDQLSLGSADGVHAISVPIGNADVLHEEWRRGRTVRRFYEGVSDRTE